jgi:hypothetical protein
MIIVLTRMVSPSWIPEPEVEFERAAAAMLDALMAICNARVAALDADTAVATVDTTALDE